MSTGTGQGEAPTTTARVTTTSTPPTTTVPDPAPADAPDPAPAKGPAAVQSLHVYPVKGEPGHELDDVLVGDAGLDGDRRKKAPVQVIAAQDVRDDTRANVVVTLPSDVLAATVGSVLRVGEVELDVTGPAGGCPGVYAAVRRGGTVRLGDTVQLGDTVTTGQEPA